MHVKSPVYTIAIWLMQVTLVVQVTTLVGLCLEYSNLWIKHTVDVVSKMLQWILSEETFYNSQSTSTNIKVCGHDVQCSQNIQVQQCWSVDIWRTNHTVWWNKNWYQLMLKHWHICMKYVPQWLDNSENWNHLQKMFSDVRNCIVDFLHFLEQKCSLMNLTKR